MIPEVKKRVEDIKSGEVPEGYKRTKYVGICPKEWKVGKLEDVLYNEQRPVNKPTEPYWRLGVRSWAKGTFQSLVDDPSSVAMDELYKVRENDLIVNITFAWEHAIAIAKKEDDGMLVSHRFPTYVFKPGNVPNYYKAVISQPLFKKMLEYISPGGAGRNRVLNRNDFLKLPCYILPTEEQKRIADILSEHDKIINLCEKKLEQLRLFKKACLQKMFLKKGSNVPEIRFPGFTDPWEQRKLGDIADVTKLAGFEFTGHVVYSDEGSIIALRGLNIKNGQLVLDDVKYIDGSNFAKLNRSKLFIDDIMFTYVGTVGEVAIIKENDRFYLAPNVSRIRVQSNDSPKFISHYMRTDSFYRHVIFPLIATSSQPALSMENIRKFEICLPKNRDEQDKLSEFFDGIDNLITLHQRKCDLEKEKKKALMQLLLTGIVRT